MAKWQLTAVRLIATAIGMFWAVVALSGLALRSLLRLGKNLGRVKRQESEVVKSDKWGKHTYISANGIDFHCVVKGEGPLLLLLHGFPEFWYSWRHQINEFCSTHKVVAVDMRGYNLTSKPPHTNDYNIGHYVNDVVELVKALGYEKCILMGHDGGAIVGWNVAFTVPEVVDKLIVINGPHPTAMRRNFSLRQFLKSWYVFMFQLPIIPEFLFSCEDYHTLMDVFDGIIPLDEIERYKHAISRPGALTATINQYRCIFHRNVVKVKSTKVHVPTLVVWGDNDIALCNEVTHGLDKIVTKLTLEYIKGGSHFVNQERPQEVNAVIKKFLAK